MLERIYKKLRPEWVFWEDYVIEDNLDWNWPTFRAMKELDNLPTENEIEQAIIEVTNEIEKEDLIKEYRDIEKKAIEKRSEYLTAGLLPEWDFKQLKLSKLEDERINIENEYNLVINKLITKYWNNILVELL